MLTSGVNSKMDISQATEVRETDNINEVNDLLAKGWVILSADLVGVPEGLYADNGQVRTHYTHGRLYLLGRVE